MAFNLNGFNFNQSLIDVDVDHGEQDQRDRQDDGDGIDGELVQELRYVGQQRVLSPL
jgi:hypothetical protein